MTIKELEELGDACRELNYSTAEAAAVLDEVEIEDEVSEEGGWNPYDYFWNAYLYPPIETEYVA